jgi:deoxyribose-phosphate aldolase
MPLGWLGTELELGLRNFVNKLRHKVAGGVQRNAMLVIDFPLGQNKINTSMHTGSTAYSQTP